MFNKSYSLSFIVIVIAHVKCSSEELVIDMRVSQFPHSKTPENDKVCRKLIAILCM